MISLKRMPAWSEIAHTLHGTKSTGLVGYPGYKKKFYL